jgi:isopentenyldiphosphate isomerase
MSKEQDEIIDHVDETGAVLGTVTRSEMRSRNLMHRSVFIAVLNDADQILVHRRAEWKDIWPDAWDIAVGGVVAADEPWEVAAARELAEEVGVAAELSYLGEGVYSDDHVQEFARVYLARSEGPFTFEDGEVAEAAWVPIAQIREWLDGRPVCPDSIALVLPRLDAP